jgi:hypothetical protein
MLKRLTGSPLLLILGSVALFGEGGSRGVKSAETLELSDGGIARILISNRLDNDQSGSFNGSTEHSWFEDPGGNLLVVEASVVPDGVTRARFSSPLSKDRLEISTDFGFNKPELRCPVVVSVSGRKFRALLAADGTTLDAEQAFRRSLAPALAKTSSRFRAALASLFSIGDAGLPQMGRGWAQLAIVFDKSELSSGIQIVATKPMSEAEIERFQSQFAAP